MADFLTQVKKLREESIPTAFNLVLDLGEHSYGDLEACCKSRGFGDTEEPFKEMDNMLVELITARKEAQAAEDDDVSGHDDGFVLQPTTSDFDKSEAAIRVALPTNRVPAKHIFGQLQRMRRDALKALFEVRRQRRETAEDWVGNALNDLVETRNRLGDYTLSDYFFRDSIALLGSMKGIDVPDYDWRL